MSIGSKAHKTLAQDRQFEQDFFFDFRDLSSSVVSSQFTSFDAQMLCQHANSYSGFILVKTQVHLRQVHLRQVALT